MSDLFPPLPDRPADASEADRVEQGLSVGAEDDFPTDISVGDLDANPADVLEQHLDVPLDDEDLR